MKPSSTLLAFAVALLVLGGAVYQLFSIRFASGDVYPAYSSFAPNPVGTRALFETIELLPGRRAERLIGPLRQTATVDKSLWLLGCDVVTSMEASESDIRELEAFAHLGGRVVIAFAPERGTPFRATVGVATGTNAPGKGLRRARRVSPSANRPAGSPSQSLAQRWEFDVDYQPLKFDARDQLIAVTALRADGAPTTLPDNLSWHTSTVLRTNSANWRVLFERENKPVVIERDWGRGSIAVITDSYVFSNEALRRERETAFIEWVMGPSRVILFDETHLGIEENPGIATLARRYHLEGLAIGIVVLALLYLWRTASSLVPRESDPSESTLSGRQSSAGFLHLLRRAVPPAELLSACMEEWEKTVRRDGIPQGRIYQVRDRFSAEIQKPVTEQNPTQTYRDICGILSPRNALGSVPVAKPEASASKHSTPTRA